MAPFGVLEPIPSTISRVAFPIGDVDLEATISAIRQLMSLRGMDVGGVGSEVHKLVWDGKDETWAHGKLRAASLSNLFGRWAVTLSGEDEDQYGLKIARLCFYATVGFVKRFLPGLHCSFDEELATMAALSKEALCGYAAQAWTTMEVSHENVHSVMAPWCQLLASHFGRGRQDLNQLIEAAVVLPYTLSSISRLLGYG